jgi:hypothetical protein
MAGSEKSQESDDLARGSSAPIGGQDTNSSNAVGDGDTESLYGINQKAFLRKLDIKLLPPLSLLYLLSFLDRSNG